MATYKKVYFHRMLMVKKKLKDVDGKSDELEITPRSIEELDKKIQYLIDNELNEHNSLRLDPETSDTVEIIEHTDDFIYARIGRAQDLISVHLRNKKTLEPAKLSIGIDQELEIFTYLLIDRENYTVAYLREQSAPSIQKLAKLIDNNFGQPENLYGEISSVSIDDAIPILKKKDIIGSISYKVSLPSDEKINIDKLGISEEQYDMLRNQKTIDIDVKLVAETNKDTIKDKTKLEKFFDKLSEIGKNIKVKAKNEDELMQDYSIVDSPFTKRTKFDFDRNAEDIESEIQKQLKEVYQSNKDDILENIK